MYVSKRYQSDIARWLDECAFILMSPWITVLNHFMSCYFSTIYEKQYPQYKLLDYFFYGPLYGLLLFLLLLPGLVGVMLWIVLCEVSIQDKFTYVYFSCDLIEEESVPEDSRNYTVASANVLLAPEIVARLNNLKHSYARTSQIAERILAHTGKPLRNLASKDENCVMCKYYSVLSDFPCLDFLCLQEVWERTYALMLIECLRKEFSHFLYDVGEYNLKNNACMLGSGLFFASKYQILDADFTTFSFRTKHARYTSQGVLCVKVLLYYDKDGQRHVGYIANVHTQAFQGLEAVLFSQLTDILVFVTLFKQQRTESCDVVDLDIICGDFNSDNMSPADLELQQHSLYEEYQDICVESVGKDVSWAIGTELRQTMLYQGDIEDPFHFRLALIDDSLRRLYVLDADVLVWRCLKEKYFTMLRWAAGKVRPLRVNGSSTSLLKVKQRKLSSEQEVAAETTSTVPVVAAESPTTEPPPQVPDKADVVIIGGGSAGCHTLYQLVKQGVKAVLLERGKLTSGTTWQSAGIVWSLRPDDIETQLLNSTKHLLTQLEGETGLDPGWVNNGGLFIASTKERLDEYKRIATLGNAFGIESSVLDPEETKKLFPLIDADVIQGSLYSPGDGTVDPSKLCKALTHSATKGGAQVIEDCPVTSILTGKNVFGARQVTGVVTPHGTIKTNHVVNCCGVWSRELAAMVGLHLPLVPMKHAYVVTEEIPEVEGLPNIRDHDSSIYFRVLGKSLCMGGYETNPIVLEKVPSDFEQFSAYELDWIVFSTHMRGAVNLIPKFETAGIKSTMCGPESFTPDHNPILGEDPRLQGFFHNCGYNASGTMLGGGCSEQLAKWVANGRPDLHMFEYDIRRFTPEQTKDPAWVFAKSHESYVTNYDIVFPHDENLAGRNFHQGPLHEELIEAGCVFEERQGWERPGWFSPKGPAPVPKYDWYGEYGTPRNSDVRYENMLKGEHTFGFTKSHNIIGEECLACREQVVLFDMSYFGKMYLCGPEAQKAADWLFTADTRRPIGKTVYTCLLNPKAGVEADVTVSAIETGTGGLADPIFKGRGFYIVEGGLSSYHTYAHIHRILSEKNFKVGLTDLSVKLGVLSLQGPNSRDVLQPLVDVDLSDEAFPYSTTQLVRVTGHLCRAVRISHVGELGWELHVPWDSCVDVYKAIWDNGSKHGLRHAGYRALFSLSSEVGYHLWNNDLRSDDNPLEAGLDSICREEGEYVGKGALDMIKKKGLKKKLAFFELQEQIPIYGLETIWRDDQVVGYLRRGEYGYSLGTSIGQGYVKHPEGRRVTPEFLQNGHYQVEVLGHRYDARLHFKSPLDPEGKRLLGIYDEPIPIRK